MLLPGLRVGVDGYYKQAHNLIDEGQFGSPIILSAFNYAKGQVSGVEFSSSYERGPWSLYGNVAYSRAIGKDIDSAQFNFSADELAYISQHYIHLDHDQRWTGSGGVAYTLRGDHHPDAAVGRPAGRQRPARRYTRPPATCPTAARCPGTTRSTCRRCRR